jgi:hypothetical protein
MLFCSDEPLLLRFGDAVAKVRAAVDEIDDVAVLAADARRADEMATVTAAR